MMNKIALLMITLCLTQQAFAIAPDHQAAFRKNFYDSCVSGAPEGKQTAMQGYCGCAADMAKVQVTDQQAMQMGLTGKMDPTLSQTMNKIISTCRTKYSL